MSVVAQKLIAEFESLPVEDKQAVAKEILRHLSRFDSGALSDDVSSMAGDQLAAILDEEESASNALNSLQRHIQSRAGTWKSRLSGVELLKRTRT